MCIRSGEEPLGLEQRALGTVARTVSELNVTSALILADTKQPK